MQLSRKMFRRPPLRERVCASHGRPPAPLLQYADRSSGNLASREMWHAKMWQLSLSGRVPCGRAEGCSDGRRRREGFYVTRDSDWPRTPPPQRTSAKLRWEDTVQPSRRTFRRPPLRGRVCASHGRPPALPLRSALVPAPAPGLRSRQHPHVGGCAHHGASDAVV